MSSTPKVLLFDLGGVIVRWVGIEELMALKDLSREDVITRFERNPMFGAYETGHCSDDEFSHAMISEFELDMPVEGFKLLWQSWVESTYPGTEAALEKLRKSYTVACLSNTNALHWDCLRDRIRTDVHFDYAYASHLINQAKPNLESYFTPAKDMGVDPADIWFFDDTEINVNAARKAGMTAYHVNRDVGVIPILIELGLIEG